MNDNPRTLLEVSLLGFDKEDNEGLPKLNNYTRLMNKIPGRMSPTTDKDVNK